MLCNRAPRLMSERFACHTGGWLAVMRRASASHSCAYARNTSASISDSVSASLRARAARVSQICAVIVVFPLPETNVGANLGENEATKGDVRHTPDIATVLPHRPGDPQSRVGRGDRGPVVIGEQHADAMTAEAVAEDIRTGGQRPVCRALADRRIGPVIDFPAAIAVDLVDLLRRAIDMGQRYVGVIIPVFCRPAASRNLGSPRSTAASEALRAQGAALAA